VTNDQRSEQDKDIVESSSLRDLHYAAIFAPPHPLFVADPEHRAHTEAIPAARIGELPGPSGTAEIHESTHVIPFRDGDPDPEGWYSGQGGITGDRTREMVPRNEEVRAAKQAADKAPRS
jgi:hypothetical protein